MVYLTDFPCLGYSAKNHSNRRISWSLRSEARDAHEGQYNLKYCLAVTLLDGQMGLKQMTTGGRGNKPSLSGVGIWKII